MKQEKLNRYALALATHAEAAWVTFFFFVLFLLDSILMFLPADSLLGATIILYPKRARRWLTVACLGSITGLAGAVILANTVLNDYLQKLVASDGVYHQVRDIIEHAQHYGYWELAAGVFTFVPSVIGAMAGTIVKLNPWLIFLIVTAAKLLKIFLTVWLLHAGGGALKRIIRVYLKTSV